jgi:tetratricopeptide (TPR) repeat protein
MTTSALKTTVASLLVLVLSSDVARAGRGGFPGGARGGMPGGMGMSGMNGMPPGMSSRGGMPTGNMGMSGMNGMPPGMSSRGGMPTRDMNMSGMNGMPPGMSSRGGVPTRGMNTSGMNGMPPGMSSRGGMPAAGTMPMNRVPTQGVPGSTVDRTGTGYANVPGGTWGNPYGAYHSGWYNGPWNGHYGGYGGYGWGSYGAGAYGWGSAAAMAGMGSWAYGPSLYNMGYASYSNPYYGSGMPAQVAQGASYNYAQPIDTMAAPAQQTVADDAVTTFDQGRAAFKANDYTQALNLTDKAIQKLPNDATLHEFRALCLFALKRYDEAGATLYAVLSAGPGWDWTTMASLYPSVDVYTGQLRSLEAYVRDNPNSASARFVLAYQYLAQGDAKNAVGQFQEVVKLQPNDTLSAKLAAMFSKSDTDATPAPPPSDAPAAKSYNLVGSWRASPAKDVSIVLTVKQDGPFSWKVTDHGKSQELGGKSTYGNGLLTLAGDQGPPLVGKVTWQDENHFTFQVAGGGTLDPGLSFAR